MTKKEVYTCKFCEDDKMEEEMVKDIVGEVTDICKECADERLIDSEEREGLDDIIEHDYED